MGSSNEVPLPLPVIVFIVLFKQTPSGAQSGETWVPRWRNVSVYLQSCGQEVRQSI